MRLLEHEAKAMLAGRGIPIPAGVLAGAAAGLAAVDLGPLGLGQSAVVKAQVPVGGRGKAGGVRRAETIDEIAAATEAIFGLTIAGYQAEMVLVEEALAIERELYLAVAIDTSAGRPVILAAAEGGVDIEDAPDRITKVWFDAGPALNGPALEPRALDPQVVETVIRALDPGPLEAEARQVVAALVELFAAEDALLAEINPLVITTGGALVAADAKIELDDAAATRHGRPDAGLATGTAAERQAAEVGLRLIDLGGDVAILANGAGLTMATMDAVSLAGGRPANFLEIGGDAYTKATPALEIVLGLPGVRSLLVNFCGAFARCDVMAAGVVEAWKALQPDIPIFFTIHGTGQDEARALVGHELGLEPFDRMDDAVEAAVAAAKRATS